MQKGKFSAGTDILVTKLNKVDLPALGKPTKPTENIISLKNDKFKGFVNFRQSIPLI